MPGARLAQSLLLLLFQTPVRAVGQLFESLHLHKQRVLPSDLLNQTAKGPALVVRGNHHLHRQLDSRLDHLVEQLVQTLANQSAHRHRRRLRRLAPHRQLLSRAVTRQLAHGEAKLPVLHQAVIKLQPFQQRQQRLYILCLLVAVEQNNFLFGTIFAFTVILLLVFLLYHIVCAFSSKDD